MFLCRKNAFAVRHRACCAEHEPAWLPLPTLPPLFILNYHDTEPTATMFGRLIHLGFDALLITALLAGIKRTTGLTYGLSHSSSGNPMI